MKPSKLTIKIIIILGLSLALLIILFMERANADLNTEPEPAKIFVQIDKTTFLDPNYLTLAININNPATSSYNAISLTAKFNSEQMQILETNYNNSFCDLNAIENINNASGTLDIICGSTHANSTATATAVNLIFKKLQSGFSMLDLSESELISSDGTGQPIHTQSETSNIYLYKP